MAEQLGVDMLLQGEVLVHGEDLDARFQAFSAAGEKSWERRFSGTTTEVVAILDDVATAFANTVGAQSAVLEPPPSARTLQLYLKGMAYLEGWDVERNHELAEQALRQTIEEDDRFAEAHAGLSRALWKQYEETRRPALVREALAAAERAAAERAAELNPDLPQAHLASGYRAARPGTNSRITRVVRLGPAARPRRRCGLSSHRGCLRESGQRR